MNIDSIQSLNTVYTPDRTNTDNTTNDSATSKTIDNSKINKTASNNEPDKSTENPENTEIQEATKQANRIMTAMNKDLEFVVDDRAKDALVVKVVDKDSGKTLRQYPPEEMLNMMARIEDTILGFLVDNKA